MKIKIVLFFLIFILAKSIFATSELQFFTIVNNKKVELKVIQTSGSLELILLNHNPVKDSLKTTNDTKKHSKLINGILSFPFPLGFLGAHRIMLGTKPWVPIVYVATFGGCFGILPLVDFCVLMLSADVKQYENNPNVFMWIK